MNEENQENFLFERNKIFEDIYKKNKIYSHMKYFNNFNKIFNSNLDKFQQNYKNKNQPIKIQYFYFGLFNFSQHINELIEQVNNYKIEYHDSKIHIASKQKDISTLQNLIEKQRVRVDLKGEGEKTPLHYACEKGHFPIVEYLISKGANIDAKDKYEETPLHYACKIIVFYCF